MDDNSEGPDGSRRHRNDVPLVTVNSPTTPDPALSQQQHHFPNPTSPSTDSPTSLRVDSPPQVRAPSSTTARAASPIVTDPASPSRRTNPQTRRSPASPALRPVSSIRIRRLPSSDNIHEKNRQEAASGGTEVAGRRRSNSAPHRPQFLSAPAADGPPRPTTPEIMPSVDEDGPYSNQITQPPSRAPVSRMRSASTRSRFGRARSGSSPVRPLTAPTDEYDTDVVDFLDVVDPEVSTLSTLTNVQNSLFVPDLGRLLNRRPTYELSRMPTDIPEAETPSADRKLGRSGTALTPYTTAQEAQEKAEEAEATSDADLQRTHSIRSVISQSHYAVLPHAVSLAGWSEEDKAEIDDYVRHQLHSRRARFKRRMRGFGKYIKKPLGFFVTLYATLITLFGLTWVLFLIGWISVGGRKSYDTNVIDNVLVALFAVVGDGLAPFRAVDTYHMCFIAHYHHLTWRLRREQGLQKLHNISDLPPPDPAEVDVESMAMHKDEFAEVHKGESSVLSPRQQQRLEHHQAKFAKSHTFYKPHETVTHHAFPLRFLVAVVVLLDCHSLFQIALGACTWGISYHVRSQALTAVILCCSICCNITGGICITIGDRRTRKKDVIERMFRQGLTEQAMNKVKKRKMQRIVEDRERGLSISEQA